MGTPILFGTNNDQNIIVQVEYDKAGRQTAQRDPRGKRTTYAYDQLNRRVSLTDPLNHTWLTAYPRLTGGGSRLTRTDPLGVVTQQDSDRLGRLAILSYLNESPKLTPDITFGYDKNGSRTRMTEANGASTVRDTRYTYTRAQRLKQVNFDTNGDGLIDQSVAYGYDAGGLRTSLTLPGSKTVTYQYDTLQQLIRLTDWNGQATNNLYDSLGRLIALTRSNGATSQYQYDGVGHLRLLRHNANGKTLAHHAYTVDARGNRTQAFEVLSKAGTGTTTLAYNDLAVSYYIGTWIAAAPYQTTTNISAALQIACLGTTLTLTMGQGPDHSIYDLYVDNTLWQSIDGYATTVGDRVLSIPVTADGPHIIDVRNRPEKNAASTGYVLRFKSLVVSGQQYDAQTIQYQYDALSRLNQARYGTGVNTLGTPFKEYDYTYDVAGNRTQQVVSSNGIPTPTNYTYDDANRLVSDGTHGFNYDTAGRLTSDGVNTYTWDRANRLLSMGGSAYQYNGAGQRVQQTVSAQVTQYLLDVQPGLEKVLQATNGVNTTSYVHGPLGIQAQQNPNASWQWLLQDGLGSVRTVLDSTATQQETRVYSPYGELTQTSGSSQSTFGFTGEPTDANGLVNLRARSYNPTIGQFMGLDPLETPNRYAYVQGNPINATDGSGLCSSLSTYPSLGYGYWCTWLAEQLHNLYAIPLEVLLAKSESELEFIALAGVFNNAAIIPQALFENPQALVQAFGEVPFLGGYLEGLSTSAGAYVASGVGGTEMVYNFQTFQRLAFTYTGGGPAVILGGSVSGSMYVGHVEGFKVNPVGSYGFDQFISDYSGPFDFSQGGLGPSLPFKIVSATGGFVHFHSPLGQGNIYGNSVYLALGAGATVNPFPVNIDASGGRTYYTPHLNNSQSYVKKCQVDVEKFTSDIQMGTGSPLIQGTPPLLYQIRQLASNAARRAANQYNASHSSAACCEEVSSTMAPR